MVLLIVLVVVLVVLVGGGAVALTLAIRYFGRQQQRDYDAQVAAAVAATQPDPAFLERQAEIERNLAAADALESQVEAQETAAPQPPLAPPAAPSAPPPDPTL